MKAVNFSRWAHLGALPFALVLATAPVWAHGTAEQEKAEMQAGLEAGKQGNNVYDTSAPGKGAPADMDKRVGFDQKIGAQLPLNLIFKDETGKSANLGQYLNGKPILMNLIQLKCNQLCSQEIVVMQESLRNLKYSAGKEFEILTVSIDPQEGPDIAAVAKDEQIKSYKRAGAEKGWHFLTGSEANIKTLAKAVGYKFIWDAQGKQYIHPEGLILLTPEGHVARYFLQFNYASQDLRFSMIEASKNKVGTVLDRIALQCFHYNPATGKYSFEIMAFLRLAAAATVLAGLTAIALMMGAEKRRGRANGAPPVLKKA